MIFYVENPKGKKQPINLSTLTRVFIKGTGYKINLQQSIVFLYANNNHVDTEIKNTIQKVFTITIKNELLRGKSNKTCVGLIHRKFHNADERIQRISTSLRDTLCAWIEYSNHDDIDYFQIYTVLT